jgi:hypothetical protein
MNFNPKFLSKGYNVNISHPIQPSDQEYVADYRKYVSIHSEDRDIIKYPSSSNFEIEMPQDMLNVSKVRLINWTFPANYDVFSAKNKNLSLFFTINTPYNPGQYNYSNKTAELIYECLFLTQSDPYVIIIEEGFYDETQMTTELTNKMNDVVTTRITNYITNKYTDTNERSEALSNFNGYNRFVVVYNKVSQKIWFGNTADGFVLANSLQFTASQVSIGIDCIANSLPEYSNWGLPYNLGLTRFNIVSIPQTILSPRFFYGDVVYGDNGYWLVADSELIGSHVYFIQAPNKINFMGDAFFYMEIHGLNHIDETSPFSLSNFTSTTNQTNGIVNAAFAKIAVPSTPISQWFDDETLSYMFFLPPAERIRRLKIKFRYHNGKLVDFNNFPYSFTLEFTLVNPQILRGGRYVITEEPLLDQYYGTNG